VVERRGERELVRRGEAGGVGGWGSYRCYGDTTDTATRAGFDFTDHGSRWGSGVVIIMARARRDAVGEFLGPGGGEVGDGRTRIAEGDAGGAGKGGGGDIYKCLCRRQTSSGREEGELCTCR